MHTTAKCKCDGEEYEYSKSCFTCSFKENFELKPNGVSDMQLLTKPELREQLATVRNELKQLKHDKELLQIGLESLADLASECDGWKAFPQSALDDAYELLAKTNV